MSDHTVFTFQLKYFKYSNLLHGKHNRQCSKRSWRHHVDASFARMRRLCFVQGIARCNTSHSGSSARDSRWTAFQTRTSRKRRRRSIQPRNS